MSIVINQITPTYPKVDLTFTWTNVPVPSSDMPMYLCYKKVTDAKFGYSPSPFIISESGSYTSTIDISELNITETTDCIFYIAYSPLPGNYFYSERQTITIQVYSFVGGGSNFFFTPDGLVFCIRTIFITTLNFSTPITCSAIISSGNADFQGTQTYSDISFDPSGVLTLPSIFASPIVLNYSYDGCNQITLSGYGNNYTFVNSKPMNCPSPSPSGT